MGHSNWHLSALCPGGRTVKSRSSGTGALGSQRPGSRDPTHSLGPETSGRQPSGPGRQRSTCFPDTRVSFGTQAPPGPLGILGSLPLGGGRCRGGQASHSLAVGGGCRATHSRRGAAGASFIRSFFPTPLPQTLTLPHLSPHSAPSPLPLLPSPNPTSPRTSKVITIMN